MKRREALKSTIGIVGYGLFFGGVTATIHSCKVDTGIDWNPSYLTVDEAKLVADIAERIIPRTDTPGAKDAYVDRFIDENITLNFTEEQKVQFREALVSFDEKASKSFKKNFIKLEGTQQDEVLNQLYQESENHTGENPHIFDVIKKMTVFGYFTSEVGAKQSLVYDAIPGTYKGCIDYSEVNGVWAF
jgi:hypothetical protein